MLFRSSPYIKTIESIIANKKINFGLVNDQLNEKIRPDAILKNKIEIEYKINTQTGISVNLKIPPHLVDQKIKITAQIYEKLAKDLILNEVEVGIKNIDNDVVSITLAGKHDLKVVEAFISLVVTITSNLK